eukprot:NODE_76_length_23837_cov_1.242396.p9 type:complete len:241 gc:universal NODE_76_length_23837_cov_1.242396:23100-22378(-)
MKFENLEYVDVNAENVFSHIVEKPDMMDTTPSLPNPDIIKGELQANLSSRIVNQEMIKKHFAELGSLSDMDVNSILAKKQYHRADLMLEEIQKIQLQPHTENHKYLGLEDRLKSLEHKVGTEFIDVLPKLHAIQQAAKFIQQNEKLLANPQMADLSKAQSLSQIYQKYSPIKSMLPKLIDRLNVIKEGQLLSNVDQQITVKQIIEELRTDMKFLKESSISLEKTIIENQKLIMQQMNFKK